MGIKLSIDQDLKGFERFTKNYRKQLRVNVNNFVFPEKRTEQTPQATLDTATIPF